MMSFSTPHAQIPLAELIASLTVALDMTEGQPPEHSMRCCWIGMHIGQALGLSDSQLHDLYFTLLLKDAGCSSNAARICELYATDDLRFKQRYKTVGTSLTSVINFVMKNAGAGESWRKRLTTAVDILKNGSEYAQELIQTRCTQGAQVARELRFNEDVAQGIQNLDEHWDGSGWPLGLKGEAIPLYARIALLAQITDVFQHEYSLQTAFKELQHRAGHWLDPQLVVIAQTLEHNREFVSVLTSPSIAPQVLSMSPAQSMCTLDDDYFDCIVSAFGKIVDAKSPFTAGHSTRVALFSTLIAEELQLDAIEILWLKRAALLHDLGKLGVSNTILDKPGKLDDQEWAEVQLHATYTRHILAHLSPLQAFAKMAAAHHEKLDGSGYPDGLVAAEISLMTRIITTADIFDAITAERPYRGAIPVPKTLEIMAENIGTAIDTDCFKALQAALAKLPEKYTQGLGSDAVPASPLL
ncbi:HD-GYP domain-containing protein [Shewanella sp.]|uniref:HD-GYP domain-containing protein n=1 Tax=Shewanella sp. TaxID=50422 RepID=UPI003A971346